MKQVTIKNIASELNLSVSTVSRALNDHPDIRKQTKKLVNKVKDEPGYRPNIIARNFKSSYSNKIEGKDKPDQYLDIILYTSLIIREST